MSIKEHCQKYNAPVIKREKVFCENEDIHYKSYIKSFKMANNMDLELKKAFMELQDKMTESTKKVQILQSQISSLCNANSIVGVTKRHIESLPPEVNTYEAVGRMFILTDRDTVIDNLNKRSAQIISRMNEMAENQKYLEKNVQESRDNIREMLHQRKDTKS